MAKIIRKAPQQTVSSTESVLGASWFFENAQDLFVVVRPADGAILSANRRWETLTGWRVEDVVGRDILDLIHPDDHDLVAAVGPVIAKQGRVYEPFRLHRKDGDCLYVEGYARMSGAGDLMCVLRDVTEAQERAKQLEQARQMRLALSETAGVGAWRYDPRDHSIAWSDEMKGLLAASGIRFTDAAGFAKACHPDDLESSFTVLNQVVHAGKPAVFNHRVRGASDSDPWMHVRVHVHGEALGDGRHMVHGLSQDITELTEAHEAAMQAERQSRRLMEQAPFAVALFDKDLRYAMVSPRWVELFQPQGDGIGHRLDELGPDVYGDFVKVQERALLGHITRSDEHRMVDSRGRVFWIRWEMHPWRDGSGEIVGVVVYVDDISGLTAARRASQTHEQRLKIALGAAKAAVIETDFKTGVYWSSPELVDLAGHDLTGAKIGDDVWSFIHPEDRPWITEMVMSWSQGAPAETIEMRIVTPGGQERWVRVYTELEFDADGGWSKSVALLLDIDESKRQALALIEAERAAQAGAEAKAQFLANMSHEIRTPMNGVLGVLHLLRRQQLPTEAQVMLAEAMACGSMLQALLDDVVDFSKIEAGRLELAHEPLDPTAVIDGVVRLLRPQAVIKGLDVVVETEGLPAFVMGDAVRLRQCLFNLLGNAVKFTAKGRVTVRALNAAGPDGPRLRFEVEDTGVGIDAETRGRLFRRFEQADATTTRRYGGSGLGLAITRRLAELMDGAVGVVSAPGVGSTFWLEIPAALAAKPEAEAIPSDAVLDGLKVLVVEDNATNRMIASKILESLGASVETADDGEQGVAAAARGGFDLILMDIQMPGIDGVEATRRIRALGGAAANTPVLALTANVLNHQRHAYLAAGMSGTVAKPISPTLLLAEIARLVAADEDAEVSPPDGLSATSGRSSARSGT
jgi:PAS domain S-box-containing protein